ncbi:hypothetical protein [Ferrimonas balearica]|uniref:hypothetical protein n=1 Tax=Ferrimonas balearica TaxID=44012 RepID=UPI001C995191|nr:hypothetical protein [Ferrimonas balearica]MBY5920845.1 hypothetical protein [Ferrimonas balearica]MBY5996470.1 hypothetical protein [Ferrimonas balearica]
MVLMMLATVLNVLGLVMVLVEQGGYGIWVLLAGLTLTLVPWLRQLTGLGRVSRTQP